MSKHLSAADLELVKAARSVRASTRARTETLAALGLASAAGAAATPAVADASVPAPGPASVVPEVPVAAAAPAASAAGLPAAGIGVVLLAVVGLAVFSTPLLTRTHDEVPPAGESVEIASAQPLPAMSTAAAIPAGPAPLPTGTTLDLDDLPSVADASPRSSSSGTALPSTDTVPSMAEEIAAVDAARRALEGGESAEALAAVAAYRRRFEKPRFSPEILAIEVEALVAAGRRSEARALAQQFIELAPESPLARRMRRVVGLESD